MPRKRRPVTKVNDEKLPMIRRQVYGSRAAGRVRVTNNEVTGILAVQGVQVSIQRGKIVVIRESDNAALRVQKTGQGINLVDSRGEIYSHVVPKVTFAPAGKGVEDYIKIAPVSIPRPVQPYKTEPVAPRPKPKPTAEPSPEKQKRRPRWFPGK